MTRATVRFSKKGTLAYVSIELEPNIFVVYRTDTRHEIYLQKTSMNSNKSISLPYKTMNSVEEIKKYGLDMLDLFKTMGGS